MDTLPMAAEQPLLDVEALAALREVMRDDYPLLVETFIADAQMRLTHLELSLRAGDWPSFAQTAHSFRGSCGNMGALAMQQSCQLAEAAADRADAEAAEAALHELQSLFARVQSLLLS